MIETFQALCIRLHDSMPVAITKPTLWNEAKSIATLWARLASPHMSKDDITKSLENESHVFCDNFDIHIISYEKETQT